MFCTLSDVSKDDFHVTNIIFYDMPWKDLLKHIKDIFYKQGPGVIALILVKLQYYYSTHAVHCLSFWLDCILIYPLLFLVLLFQALISLFFFFSIIYLLFLSFSHVRFGQISRPINSKKSPLNIWHFKGTWPDFTWRLKQGF